MNVSEAMCCFCSGYAKPVEMFCLVLYPPGEQEGERTQALFCHPGCLDRALHPVVPRHPDLLED